MAKTAIHRHGSAWLPYDFDINVYRGCAHRCVYCYALYSHAYIGGGDFYRDIYAKTNIADVLACELPRHGSAVVNLGGVCDSYQPAERRLRLMPRVLALLAAHRVPVVVCTKSPLILRDIEWLKRVRDANALGAALTITTMDTAAARLLEPGAPEPRKRMDAVAALRKSGIRCGVHMMPVIPFLTDGKDRMEAVFEAARRADADYVLAGMLNLRGYTRQGFMDAVRQAFPAEFPKIAALYADKSGYRAYKAQLYLTLEDLRKKYAMPGWRRLEIRKEAEQLSFL